MSIRSTCLAAALALTGGAMAAAVSPGAAPQTTRSWNLGADADTKKSPVPATAQTLEAGKALFKDKCARCHGPGAIGDGPDADPDATEMDLTNPKRAARNPDGVVYYKVLNGKQRPKMPAFKDDLSEEQIWTVVAYVQSLRKQP